MNLKKELEKMNHADLLWICKYMKVSCNSDYTNKKIIGILLEPISNKKYRAGRPRVFDQNDEEFNTPIEQQLTPQEKEQAQEQAQEQARADFLSRLEALSLTQKEPEKTTQKEPEKTTQKEPQEKPQEKSSNCTIC